MDKKLIELYKSGHMVIPLYLLKNYKDLKLDLDEFIFLMYLYNKGDKELFDPGKISNDLNIPLKDVMKYIYKKYISKYGIKWSCFVLEPQQELFLSEALRKILMLYTYTKYVSTK